MQAFKKFMYAFGAALILISCGGEKEDTDPQPEPKEEEKMGPFISDYRIGLDSAKSAGKPLLVYFSGYSCTDCRTFEEVVLNDPEVVKMLPDFVVVQLMTDEKQELPASIAAQLDSSDVDSLYGRSIENIGELWTAFQELNFDTTAQPYVVALSDCEQWLAKPVGGSVELDGMLNFLTEVQGNFPIDTSFVNIDSMNVIMFHPGFENYWVDKAMVDTVATEADVVENQTSTEVENVTNNEANTAIDPNKVEEKDAQVNNVVAKPTAPSVKADHLTWYMSVDKIDATTYDLKVTAVIDGGWHTYSVTQDPLIGPVPTTFSFKPNAAYEIVGRTGEKGAKSKYMQIWGSDVKYFENRAEFRQRIRAKSDAAFNVDAIVNYMLCNDEKCLPPKDLSLSWTVDPTK